MKKAWGERSAPLHRQLMAALVVSAMGGVAAAAETWPVRPVRLVLSFGAPGGSPDTIARLIGPRLSELWGKQLVVDPRAGAGGVLGTDIAAKAPPDGYTMVVVSPAHAINPALRGLPYDSVRDFEPVTKLAEVPNILAIYPPLGARSAQEVAAMAKAKPGAYAGGYRQQTASRFCRHAATARNSRSIAGRNNRHGAVGFTQGFRGISRC